MTPFLTVSGMLRRAFWLVGGAFAALCLLVLLAGGALLGANTDIGRRLLADAVASLSGGRLHVAGITGHFPDDFRISRIELADAKGVWLRIDDMALEWSPRRLLRRDIAVRNLTAARIEVARLPAAGDGGTSDTGTFVLPVRVNLERLKIQRIEIGQPVLGIVVALSADGEARIDALEQAEGSLTLRRLDQPGAYTLSVKSDAAGLHARLQVREQGDALLAAAIGLPELGPVTADANADGPVDALATRIVLDAGRLHAEARGMVHLNRQTAETVVTVNEIAPLAALAGLDLQGRTSLTIQAARNQRIIHLDADGSLTLTGGPAKLPELIGPEAKIRWVADLHGQDIGLSRFSLAGAGATASANGSLKGDRLDLNLVLGLPELRVLVPTMRGALQASLHLAGPLADFTASADLTGTVAAPGLPSGPLRAHTEARGLPDRPAADITASGDFAGAPLDLALSVASEADGALRARIGRASWRSAQAHGELTLAAGGTLPGGHLELAFGRLADLTPLLGQPVSGALSATLDSTAERASLSLDARGATMAGGFSVGSVKLSAVIPAPSHPVADVKLTAEQVQLAGMPGPLVLRGEAQLDLLARQATIAALRAGWNRAELRLLNPLRVQFADGVRIDRLRLGLQQAVLEASGQISPTLDLTASVSGVTPELVALFVPGVAADGSLRAEARLTGTPARPSGTVRIEASGLRPHGGTGRGLPPGQFNASAALTDGRANIDARLTAGTASLTMKGVAPLAGGGPMDLRAEGNANLALLEPLLSPAGRRASGDLAVHASLRGTLADPRIDGQISLTGGTFQDYNTGLNLSAISARLHGDGDRLFVDTFTARAGPGTIGLTGSLGILAAGMPVDLSLTARNARPLSNDLLTAMLDADLTVKGEAAGTLDLSGTVKLLRADIRIPETLPASIPVLNVIRPGARPTPPPAPALGQDIRLNLTLNAPRQIFVRGRGLDAELGGIVHLTGTLANPQPDGRFQLRRGDFSLIGQTITFTKGEIGFDGGSLTDPSLNFLASRAGNNVVANLAITGTASAPKIALSSTPPLPQDEVLSQLLLGRSAATLSALELAQVAAGLASLTGVTSGLDPFNTVRSGLGLDRLSIGNRGGSQKGGSTLDAGRYIAPGIYIGARQSLTGNGTQSVVQIDITKSLKVEGTVGTGTASATGNEGSQATGIAVIYQRDY